MTPDTTTPDDESAANRIEQLENRVEELEAHLEDNDGQAEAETSQGVSRRTVLGSMAASAAAGAAGVFSLTGPASAQTASGYTKTGEFRDGNDNVHAVLNNGGPFAFQQPVTAPSLDVGSASIGGQQSDRHWRLVGKDEFSNSSGTGQRTLTVDTSGSTLGKDSNHYVGYYYVKDDQREQAPYTMRINSDSSTVYDYQYTDGTSVTGDTRIMLIDASNNYIGGHGWFEIARGPSSKVIGHRGYGRLSRISNISDFGSYEAGATVDTIDISVPDGGSAGAAKGGLFIYEAGVQG